MRIISTVFIFIVLASGKLQAQNLIKNGSFEIWSNGVPDGWEGLRTNFDAENVLQSDTAAFGKYSAQLINTGSSHKRFTCDSLNVIEGESYQITFLVKGVGKIRTCLYDTAYGKYNTYIDASPYWQKHIQTVTANVSSTKGEFIFSVKETDDFGIYLDSVVIEKFFGAEIYSFVLAEEIRPALINSNLAQVSSTVDWSADMSKLNPVITVSPGATIKPLIEPVVFDGINPVEYRVSASNGSSKLWNVFVRKAAPPIKTSIYNIQITENENGDSPKKGNWIETFGIVTGIDTSGFFMQDGEGSWTGIRVNSLAYADSVSMGDSITITGLVDEADGLTQLSNIYTTKINSHNNALPPAMAMNITDVNESVESVLAKIKDVACVSTPNASNDWEVGDEKGNILTIGSQLFAYSPTLNDKFNSIAGCITFSDNTFKLLPRDTTDFDLVPIAINETMLSGVVFYPNPVAGNLFIDNAEQVKQLKICNLLGQTIMLNAINTQSTVIDLTELNSGMYVLSFVSKTGITRSERLIVK